MIVLEFILVMPILWISEGLSKEKHYNCLKKEIGRIRNSSEKRRKTCHGLLIRRYILLTLVVYKMFPFF